MRQPLSGVRVIDISRLEIGAMATQVLADLGADVIKVEPLGAGEEIRRYVPRLGSDAAFVVASYRNKRSIQVDLKSVAGRDVILDLMCDADVFVEVSRRGVMDRLGLDQAALKAVNPRLVYCSLLAFGNDGPLAMQNSHSPDIDFYAGVASVEDDPRGGLKTPDMRNISAHAGASAAATGMLAALFGAKVHGEGSYVEISMWDAAIAWDSIRATMALNGIWFPGGDSVGTRDTPKHAAYRTLDGAAVSISTVEERYWIKFCDAIERRDLAPLVEDPDNATDFGSSFAGLYDEVAKAISRRTAAEWETIFAAADVPFAVVQTRLEALTSQQAQERDLVWQVPGRDGTEFPTVGRSFLLDGDRGEVRRGIPRPGEHTDEILREFGYDSERIARLRDERAIE